MGFLARFCSYAFAWVLWMWQSYFCGCTQLIMGDKQSFMRPIWITFVNIKWILVLQTLSDFIQAGTKEAKARRQSSCSGIWKGFPEMLSRSSLSIQTPQWLPEHSQRCCWLITQLHWKFCSWGAQGSLRAPPPLTHTEPMTKSICNSQIQGQSFQVSRILHKCKV